MWDSDVYPSSYFCILFFLLFIQIIKYFLLCHENQNAKAHLFLKLPAKSFNWALGYLFIYFLLFHDLFLFFVLLHFHVLWAHVLLVRNALLALSVRWVLFSFFDLCVEDSSFPGVLGVCATCSQCTTCFECASNPNNCGSCLADGKCYAGTSGMRATCWRRILFCVLIQPSFTRCQGCCIWCSSNHSNCPICLFNRKCDAETTCMRTTRSDGFLFSCWLYG